MTAVKVLGPLAVVAPGGRETLVTGRTGQLLGVLALFAGRAVRDDELIDALWPGEEFPPDPAGTLRSYVTRARRTLAPLAIERGSGGYRVEVDPADVDATVFEQRVTAGLGAWRAGDPARCADEMNAALGEWRGRPWSGLDGWPPAEIDTARLCELREQAAEYAAASLLALGDVDAAAAGLVALCEEAPLREFRWELLMRAQALQGRQADALRTFQRARDVLVEELGIDPSPRLRDIEAAVLEQRSPAPLLAEPVVKPDVAPRPRPAEPGPTDPLVGRSDAVGTLHAVLGASVGGPARIVVVAGEPGIGKTRLLDEAALIAGTHGRTVHRGRCFEEESSGAYRPVIEVLRSLAAVVPPPEADRSILAILLPELAGGADPASPTADDTQFRLFDAAARLFRRAADTGAVVIVDDMHWADPASIDLLGHCVRHAADLDLALVVAYRPKELDAQSPLIAWLATSGRLVATDRIELTGLTDDAVAELLRRTTGDAADSVVSGLQELTGGNPLFLRELMAALRDRPRSLDELLAELPAGLVDVLRHRLAGAGAEHQSILRRVSIHPAGVPVDLLAATLPLDRDALLDRLDELTSGGLLTERVHDGGPVYAFSHELLRVAMNDGLSLGRRAALHHGAALAADRLAAGDPYRWTAVAADHWFEGGRAADPVRTEIANVAAGEIAYARTAFADARRCFERALTALEWQGQAQRGAPLHLRAAEAAHRVADVAARQAHAERAVELATAEGDAATVARAAIAQGGSRSTYGISNPTTTRLLEHAAELLEDRPDLVGLRASVLARLAQEVNHAGDLEGSRTMSAEAVALATDLDDDRVAATVFRERVWTLNHPDWLEEREARIEEMLERSRRVGDDELEMEARVWRASARIERGDARGFDAELEALDALGRRCPVPALLVRVATLRATRAAMRGEVEVAMELAQEANELGRRVESENADQVLQAQMIAPLREQGLLGAVLPLVAELADSYREVPGWRCALTFVLAEAGEHDAAAEELAALRSEGFNAIPRDLAWSLAVTYLADAVAILGDGEAAEELEPLLMPFSGRNASLWDIASNGAVDHYVGRLALTRGDPVAALPFLERAVDLNTGSEQWPASLRSRLHLAAARRAAGAGDAGSQAAEIDAVISSAGSEGWAAVVADAEAARH